MKANSTRYATYVGGAPAEVMRAIQRQHADATTGHAEDLTDTELVDLVKAASPRHQPTMYLMLVSGCHAEDARKVRRTQVVLTAEEIWW